MKMTKKIIASALAATMVMASSAMVFADDTTGSAVNATGDAANATGGAAATYTELTKCSYSATTEVKDGVAYVTVSVKGDVSAFDFGFLYNADEVEYDTYDVSEDFNKAFVKKAKGILTDNDQKDQSYVVFGGTSDDCTFDGVALTLAFNLKDASKTPTISVVKDSKAFLDAYKAAGQTGTMAEFVATKPFGDETPEPVVAEVKKEDKKDDNTTTDDKKDNNGSTTTTTTTTTTTAPATTTAAAATTAKKSPKTGDAGVVLPIVAICGAAAAVAVASKKKVED